MFLSHFLATIMQIQDRHREIRERFGSLISEELKDWKDQRNGWTIESSLIFLAKKSNIVVRSLFLQINNTWFITQELNIYYTRYNVVKYTIHFRYLKMSILTFFSVRSQRDAKNADRSPLWREANRNSYVDLCRLVYESHRHKWGGDRVQRRRRANNGGRQRLPRRDERARGQSGRTGVVSTSALTNCDTTGCHIRSSPPRLDHIRRATN